MAAYESHEPPPSSSSSSSSLCGRWRYDVYLGFRGNDTRNNFADLIYMAMRAAGANVFRYVKELQVGESISEKLFEAIEYSKISVIIFSEDYAASSWCLDELVKIMRCRTTFQQQVIPIFYRVDLDSFAEAFAKHHGRFAEDDMSRWREAFTEAASMGLEYKDGYEEEFYESFLKVLGTLKVKFLETDYRKKKKKKKKKKLFLETAEEIQECERKGYFKNQGGIVDDGANGRKIGKLFVSGKEICKRSDGTTVFEGTYSGRVVAVKRHVQAHHDVAFKEIQNLIASDKHPNIVQFYGEERDQNFVYLALEQWTCSLADLIQIYSQNTLFSHENKVRLDSTKDIMGDINLWKANRRPSPLLSQLMREVVSGLEHLHELGIIHRDLKPQNVLIIKEKSFRVKLSDMGNSERLHPDISSLGRQATVCGTSGWQAPEQLLLHGRQTRAPDLFNLGCVLFFCITRGRHPFGDDHQGVVSVVEEYIPEAADLFSQLLDPDPESRPEALQVLQHPLFWDSDKRLSFVRQTSGRVKLKAESNSNDLLNALENIATLTFGAQWDTKMDPTFIANECPRGSYNFKRVRDLLRVMRNKWTHYEELSKEIQEILGPVPEGFDDYFASLFPKLLIEVYKVVDKYCKEEERFQKYLRSKV